MPTTMWSADVGSTNLTPGEKIRGVDHPSVARQCAEALPVLQIPRLHFAILPGGEHYVASAAVKHQLNACTAFNAEHGRRCLVGDHVVSVQQACRAEERANEPGDPRADVQAPPASIEASS